MRILFLDDDQNRFDELKTRLPQCFLHWVKNYYEMIEAINSDRYDVIMLDHDLGCHLTTAEAQSVGDGAMAAKYLNDNRLLVGDEQIIIVHSLNPVGVANMMSHMKHADHLVVYKIPGAWAKVVYDKENGLRFLL